MPFESYAQKTYLKNKHPGIYRRWMKKYGGHVKGNKKRKKGKSIATGGY